MKRLYHDICSYYNYIKYSAIADLKSEVTNSYLDWFWWILEPICNMLIFYFIFGFIFHMEESYFLVFIFSGITLWNYFNKCVTTAVRLIKDSKGIITRVYIPKQVLLLEKMMVNFWKLLISSGIVVVLLLVYRVPIDYHIFALVPVMIVFFIFTYGVCCILMHFGVYVDDLSYIVGILLNMLFYFTGIFYSILNQFPNPLGILFERVNPLAFFISSMRYAIMFREDVPFITLMIWTGISIFIAYVGTKLIYNNENNYVKVV